MKKLKLKDEMVNPAELKPAEINPNKMSDVEFSDLKKRMKDYGEPNIPDPIFVSKEGIIIGGHHRVKAALELEWKTIRITRVLNDLTLVERMFLQRQHNKHGAPDDKVLMEYYAELQLVSDMDSIKYELETSEDEVRELFEDKKQTIKKFEVLHECPKCGFRYKPVGKKDLVKVK